MGNVRNTIAYFKKEVTPGTAVLPSSDTDGYVSIEKPDVTSGQKEILESELLSGNIGVKKPQLGLESASAAVVTELRSHGDASNPTEPDFGALLESAIGTPNISTAEAVQAAPAPSTTEFGIATEGNVKKFDMMIIDNATDGRVVRFVASMKVDIVTGVNDKIDFNDGGGEENATLNAGTYIHGGSAVSGSIGEEIKTRMEALVGMSDTITVTAVEQSDGSYIYTIASDGSTLSLLLNTGANAATAFLKLNGGFGSADLTGALTYTAASSVFGNRVVCNVAMTSAPTAADVVNATVNYKPINELHEHLTAGFYHSNSDVDGYFEQIIGALVASMGVSIEAGAISKLNFDLQALKAARTATTKASHIPDYEDVQGMTGFNVQAFFGSTEVCGTKIDLSVENEISEKLSFCEESGKSGSIVRKRTVTGSIDPYADGSVTYYDALTNLTDFSVMIVIGRKDSGGFVVGETVAFYMPQVMLTQDKTSDIDDNQIEDINFQAHTGSSGDQVEFVASFG